MAEAAGLAVGGVALVSLVDTTINTFGLIESGASYGRTYNQIALKLSLSQLRLARWRDSNELAMLSVTSDADKFEELLGEIEANFEDAQSISKQYKQGPITADNQENNIPVAALVSRVRTLAETRQESSSVLKKARWALHDEKRFNRLANNQSKLVDELIDLFPAAQEQQMQVARRDAQDLVQQPELVNNGPGRQILHEAAEEVFPKLLAGLQEVGAGSKYTFRNISTIGTARQSNGEHVAKNYKGRFLKGTFNYDKISAADGSRQSNGNSYGGKSVFDD
ncbi:Putative prion-inhibition and propagation, HeLo domain, HeLo domain superfamily [Septoria linicola]|uniref:Prion-inhibition and propagation, HeLo domain, HeLo domain superfamily n=1 Tax=Septoria linicola TaxID=215465 RepID=A0A9Q9EKV8_9PEZI|nr:Putative prion-inhibition and propagation, HeLo domain, HeLo domain superfamily [Septoria linicola]